MRKTFLLGLLTCVLGLFTACSSDNNEEKNGGTAVVTGEKIVEFTDNEGTTFGNFKYDNQGRLVSVTVEEIDDNTKKRSVVTYTYSNNQIQARSTGAETATATFVLTNGKITKATYTGEDSMVYYFTYDNQNQLISVASIEKVSTISWENGNIKTINNKYSNHNTTQVFTYSKYSSKNFMGLTDFEDCVAAVDGVDPILFMQGYYGKFVQNLVSNIAESTSKSNFKKNTSYTYLMNERGQVEQVVDSDKDYGIFTWK
ncbi:DUF4595 domain-containing protein [Hoylesella nanceiensis]